MLPGDSLIDKIFEEERIKNTKAMIVVLSNDSVNKRWVKEETECGMVKKISGSTKIIPIIIDIALFPRRCNRQSVETIKDLNNYEEEFQRILATIFGTSLKPPIGTPPKYVQFQIDSLPGLNKNDTIDFKTVCEKSLEIESDWISTGNLMTQLHDDEITEEMLYKSTEMLNSKYLIQGTPNFEGKIDFFQITSIGFETFTRQFLPKFDSMLRDVLLKVVNEYLLTTHHSPLVKSTKDFD